MPPKRSSPHRLDYRSTEDDAWYGVKLALEGDAGEPLALRIRFCEFDEGFDEVVVAEETLQSREAVDEFEKRFRLTSVQLQDNECARVIEGMEVCVSQQFADDDLRFYDAIVDSVTNSEHKYANGELVCTCTFEVFWHHGPLGGTRSKKKVQDICILQSDLPEDPTLKYFLDYAIEKLSKKRSDKRASMSPRRTPGLRQKVVRLKNDTSDGMTNDTGMVNASNQKPEKTAGMVPQNVVTQQNDNVGEKFNETNNAVNAASRNPNKRARVLREAGTHRNETNNAVNASNRSPSKRPRQQHEVATHRNEPRIPIEDEFLDISKRKVAPTHSHIKTNINCSSMRTRSEPNVARPEHVINGVEQDYFTSHSSRNKGNLNLPNGLQSKRHMPMNRTIFSHRPPRPHFEIRKQCGERFHKEDYFVIWIENLDKDLSPGVVRRFIFERTNVHCQVELSQSLLPIASSAAVIFIKTKEHAEKLLRFLLNPAHFVISSSRRPWLAKEEWCQKFNGTMPREENYTGTRDVHCSNKIRMVYRGTLEYERVKKLHKLRCEFYDHVGSLHRNLESEEKKLLLSRE